MNELVLAPTTDEDSAPLRRTVLRAGREDLPLRSGSDAFFLGVYDGERLVSTGNIHAEAPEWNPAVVGWRIHGMATDEAYRGRGAGALILGGLIDHARTAGATLVWCHARVGAREFYRRHGFTEYGDEWFEPAPYGPHVAMQLHLGGSNPEPAE